MRALAIWLVIGGAIGCAAPRARQPTPRTASPVAGGEPIPPATPPFLEMQGWPAAVDLSPLAPALPPLAAVPSFARVRAAWPRVCERRGAMTDAELAYVEAWCGRSRDGDAATITRLRAIEGSASPLATAARDDLITLMVLGEQSSDAIDEALGTWHEDVGVREQLAFAYLQTDHARDARALTPRAPRPRTRAECTLALHDILIEATPELRTLLRGLASTPCGDDTRAILAMLDDRDPDEPAAVLARAVVQWGAVDWIVVARAARAAMPYPGAEAVAIAAYTNAAVNCTSVADDVKVLRARADRDPALDARLDTLLIGRDGCKH